MSAPEEFYDLPCAHAGPAGSARLKSTPEDFVVREWLGFEADGEGEHWLLRVRKRDANTMWVAKQLAKLAKVRPVDVGFAGLKDRDAVAEQAFTVPVRSAIESWIGVSGEQFEVIAAERHRRKLKRGALRGNEFSIVLRDFEGDARALEARLQTIARAGVPNYFGPQRFGRAGSNVQKAIAWFTTGEEPAGAQRGFALSAARSVIFNAVLAERVREGTWNRLQPGDVANLDGSGSVFPVERLDETLAARCEALDLHPTGPLWGAPGRTMPGELTAQLERRVADSLSVLADGLERAGLEAERRALRARVEELQWRIEGSEVHLTFRLGRGAFATAVLKEAVSLRAETGEV